MLRNTCVLAKYLCTGLVPVFVLLCVCKTTFMLCDRCGSEKCVYSVCVWCVWCTAVCGGVGGVYGC